MNGTLRGVLSLTVSITAGSVLCCAGAESDFPAVDGWTRAGDVAIYDADNLWEYINGAAELFIEYDVQTCMTADLSAGDLVVTVELYDMGTPLNAFGVFKREHPSRGISIPGAAEAAVSPPYQALLLKGSTYAKVNAVEGELSVPTGRALLEALARALPGQTGHPSELELLPQNGIVAGSEGYKRRGYLGLTELNDCLYANYVGADGQPWEGFVVLPPAGSTPTSVWDALAGEWASTQLGGRTVLYKDVPYRGLAGVIQTEKSILGVSGAPDRESLLRRLEGFAP
jgi:hypothetical protein